MLPTYLKLRLALGCITLVAGLLAANLALFGWSQPEGVFYLLGEGANYACAYGGFAAIILGSMLINDFLVMRSLDLKKEAIWYAETAFEEGKILLGQFFQENERDERKVVVQSS